MPWELFYIRYILYLECGGGCTADAFAIRNPDTCYSSLERPEYEFIFLVSIGQIEARPIKCWKRMKYKSGKVGHIRNGITFVTY